MSAMYEKIKRWYETGVYTEAMVRKLAAKGQLTKEELEEILHANDEN